MDRIAATAAVAITKKKILIVLPSSPTIIKPDMAAKRNFYANNFKIRCDETRPSPFQPRFRHETC